MDLNQFVGLAGAPLVTKLTEWTKQTFPNMEARWFPSIAVAWGVILSLVLAWILVSDLRAAAVVGVITGLLSSSLFAIGKVGEPKTETAPPLEVPRG